MRGQAPAWGAQSEFAAARVVGDGRRPAPLARRSSAQARAGTSPDGVREGPARRSRRRARAGTTRGLFGMTARSDRRTRLVTDLGRPHAAPCGRLDGRWVRRDARAGGWRRPPRGGAGLGSVSETAARWRGPPRTMEVASRMVATAPPSGRTSGASTVAEPAGTAGRAPGAGSPARPALGRAAGRPRLAPPLCGRDGRGVHGGRGHRGGGAPPAQAPRRPMPGSFSAGWARSRPTAWPRRFSSIPLRGPTERPR